MNHPNVRSKISAQMRQLIFDTGNGTTNSSYHYNKIIIYFCFLTNQYLEVIEVDNAKQLLKLCSK